MDRRDFLKGGVVAAGAAIAAGSLAGCSSTDTEGSTSSKSFAKETDILVIGGGIGGTIAGYEAAQGGAKVIVAESGAELGGSMLISTGALHTGGMTTPDDVALMAPTSNQEMSKDFMTKWVDFRDNWLPETGAPNATIVNMSGMTLVNVGAEYDAKKEFFDFFQDEIENAGGELMLNTQGVELIAEGTDNTVVGAVLVDADGTRIRVKAKKVILATGGFGADPSMVQAHVGTYADQGVPRTVPFNTGAGQRMAMALGAQLTPGMGRFYGHVVPWPNLIPSDKSTFDAMDKNDARNILGSIQNYISSGIVVNVNGERFVDEGASHVFPGDTYTAIMLLRQEMGHGYAILDSSNANAVGAIKTLSGLGATIDTADTLDGLADALSKRSVRKSILLKTFDEYNTGNPDDFAVPHSGRLANTAAPLTSAPFYAVQVTGGYSAMFGGLKIDTDARVLGGADVPIPNLYATACCAGGFAYDEYVGSLSLSAVYGKAAADHAVANL